MIWLWLDDMRDPAIWAKPPGDWTWVTTVQEAKDLLKTGCVELASLDNDLGYDEQGLDLIKWMAEFDYWPTRSCSVHSSNPVAHNYISGVIERYGPY